LTVSASTCPRARRAYWGHQITITANMAWVRPGPRKAVIPIAMINAGKAMKMSATRMTASPVRPP
jgi:hypothetical protein